MQVLTDEKKAVDPQKAEQFPGNPEDNFNTIGRMFYAASTALCVPHSHSE